MGVIDNFMWSTRNMASPEIFRKWTAVSMIGATMSRRVWTAIEGDLPLFGNLYVFLDSPPGIGKTRPMEVAKMVLLQLKKQLHLKTHDPQPVSFLPDETTPERMVEKIGEVFGEGAEMGDRSFLGMIFELGTFMRIPDPAWMQAMARLWDCPTTYERETKHCGCDYVMNPYINLLVGVQPAWFVEGFPKRSYELGLPARIFFVWSDEKPERELFTNIKQTEGLDKVLSGLCRVYRAKGHVRWTAEAKSAFKDWAGPRKYEPKIDDPMLVGYNTRRDMHAGKLALIMAMDRKPEEKTITLDDLQRAWDLMFEAEGRMPEGLQLAGGNLYRSQEEDVVKFITDWYIAQGRGVLEPEVRSRLGRTVSPHLISSIIDELIQQRRIKVLAKPGADERLKRILLPIVNKEPKDRPNREKRKPQ